MSQPSYLDATLSAKERAEDLLSRLTIEEKAGQLSQYFYFGTMRRNTNIAEGIDNEIHPTQGKFRTTAHLLGISLTVRF